MAGGGCIRPFGQSPSTGGAGQLPLEKQETFMGGGVSLLAAGANSAVAGAPPGQTGDVSESAETVQQEWGTLGCELRCTLNKMLRGL